MIDEDHLGRCSVIVPHDTRTPIDGLLHTLSQCVILAVRFAQKSEGSSKHRLSASEVMNQAMSFLISSDWVLGEATDLNIHVSEGEVRHTFDHIRNQQFPKKKEFKAWLKQSGQTVADLLFRVRLNLNSTRIQKHVLAGHRGSRSQHDGSSSPNTMALSDGATLWLQWQRIRRRFG